VSSPVAPTEQAPHPADTAGEHVFAGLRERLYGAISCLAALAVLARYTTADTSAWSRLLDVAVATGGLWAASLFADFVAHLGVAAGFGLLKTYTAMWVAMWALAAELGLIALFAVRKTQLRWWEKLLTVLILASFGAVVLVIKMLAH
jgi:hypothetical protein